ncbi:MAG: hypothetical protein ACJ74G_24645 [Blastocatellia bacterium]
MRFEKFSAPIERDIGGGVSLIVNEARLNQSGLVEARVELWNGKLLNSGVVLTAKEAERDKYRDRVLFKTKAAKMKGVKKAEIDAFLLDLDASLSAQLSAATAQTAATPADPYSALDYKVTPKGMVWARPTAKGTLPVALTNFIAEIKGDTIEDDGAETRCVFDIEITINGRTEMVSVPAAQFPMMRWAVEHMGAHAIIFPGCQEQARCAIQMLSKNTIRRRLITHTGWRKIKRKDGTVEYGFFHADGAIGASGKLAKVSVKLSPELSAFKFPEPPQGDALKDAIRASLYLLNVAPALISYPLLAAIYRAPLGSCDFSVHLSGPSGAGKSELAALAQQHYGAAFDARNLPASWVNTSNANEAIAFTLKDVLMVIDDFAPGGSTTDIQRMHRDADRLLRGQGNQAGRKRMRADATLRPEKHPRGLILSTGEDVPRGKSLRARLLISEVGPDDMDWDCLTKAQSYAASGLLMSGMSGFIQWVAPRYETFRNELRTKIAYYRNYAAQSGMHKRTPEIVANLALGWRCFLDFAYESGAITEQEKKAYWTEGWQAFGQAALMQSRYQSASDPVQIFLDSVQAAMASGRAHVACVDGSVPANPQAWGWWEFGNNDWTPKGRRIGWVDATGLYLEKDAAFAEVQAIGAQSGEPLSISAITLHKRLHERGLLISTEHARGTLHIRKKLDGVARNVLHLKEDVFSASVPSAKKTDISDIDDTSVDNAEDTDMRF